MPNNKKYSSKNYLTFANYIYKKLSMVPLGKVTTYKLLAESIRSKAYRAVGSALKNNPNAPFIPCHRVICSNGQVGGFKGSSATKNINEKIKLLEKEGIKFKNKKIKNLNQYLFKFKLN